MSKKRWKVMGTLLFVLLFALTAQTSFCRAESAETDTAITAENPYMTEAIREALDGISQGHGGPFGCVIVKDDEIIGSGHNMVLEEKDSTAHGEITAIRNAENALDSYDLSGCVLYTTGEPCPMCLYAILWANISKVYYGCTIEDNAGCACTRFSGPISARSIMAVRSKITPISVSGTRRSTSSAAAGRACRISWSVLIVTPV